MQKSILERYEAAHAAFMDGEVESQSNEQLLIHLSGLANQNNINSSTQHRDIIRGLTINNILLKRHLDGLQEHVSALNRQNSRTQLFVIALTIASLLGTAVQVFYAYRADAKTESEMPKLSVPATPKHPAGQSVPTQAEVSRSGTAVPLPPVSASRAK